MTAAGREARCQPAPRLPSAASRWRAAARWRELPPHNRNRPEPRQSVVRAGFRCAPAERAERAARRPAAAPVALRAPAGYRGRMRRRDRATGDTALTVDEATAIAEHAENGDLDMEDPEVRRLVGEANRLLVRAGVWGIAESPKQRSRRRLLAVGASVLVLSWLAGLFLPLLVRLTE